MNEQSNGRNDFDNFAFVRLFAAFLVLYSHQFALMGRPEPVFIGIHSLGGLGVLIFFSISGFLVSKSWLSDSNLIRFAARRILRIWPAYAITIVLTVLVMGPMLTSLPISAYISSPQTREYLFGNLFFVMRETLPGVTFSGSSLPNSINGSLWTIPLELVCYAVLAGLGVLGAFRKPFIVPTLAVVLVLFHAVIQVRGELLLANNRLSIERFYFFEFLIFFLIGGSLRLFWPADRKWLRLPLSMVMIGGAIALLLGRPMLSALIWVPFISLWIGTARTFPINQVESVGDLSYGFYLFAFPVQQLVVRWFHSKLDFVGLLLISTLLTLICAYLSWYGIERWALRYKPRAPLSRSAGLATANHH